MSSLRTTSLLASLWLSLVSLASPPQVISALPDDGDTAVDPALTEIRIEFDQDMSDGSFSICGGGPSFPKLSGKPRWETPRLLILPVALQPKAEYAFGINCPSARNTRSATGESAIPYPISFSTRAINDPAPPPLSPAENAKAFEALRSAITDSYSYRDTCGVDWNQTFTEFTPRLTAATTPAAFARTTARLLARAKDLHNSVRVGSRTFATHRREVPPNANPDLIARSVPEFAKASSIIWTGRFTDGIAYINVLSWMGDSPAVLDPAFTVLHANPDARGVIIDVRFNSGGDERLARQLASRFIDAPATYSKSRFRDPAAPDGLGPFIDRRIEPAPEAERFRGKVAILMGPANMSSCESFLLMAATSPRARLFGSKSYGSSGNPQPHDLGNGVTVFLSSWQDFAPDGTLVEGKGVAPTVEVEFSAGTKAESDPVLDAALSWIRE